RRGTRRSSDARASRAARPAAAPCGRRRAGRFPRTPRRSGTAPVCRSTPRPRGALWRAERRAHWFGTASSHVSESTEDVVDGDPLLVREARCAARRQELVRERRERQGGAELLCEPEAEQLVLLL